MKFTKLLIVLVVLYGAALFFVIFAFNAGSNAQEGNDLKPSTSFLTTQDPNTAVAKAFKKLPTWKSGDSITGLKYNPFELLGAYPDPVPYIGKKLYHRPHFGLINENDYCDKVDEFNLEHPEHIFDEMNFYTDLFKNSILKKRVMKDMGAIWNADMMRTMSKEDRAKRHNKWDKNITLFHVTGELFYRFHEIGKHFMCATQVFSHIPNHTNLLQKDHFPQSVQDYKRIYKDRPQCYESISFPPTYRLFDQGECSEFFRLINSRKYLDSLKTTPIQYLVKIGHGAHKAEGVFLLDQEETDRLNTRFNKGGYCGEVNNILIVQKYIGNPMLLDNNNKFHMRVYVLIASTNPLIVYYHDGYLRASIFPFDKTSTDRATHLTNLLMGDQVAEIAKNNNLISSETANMTVKELEDYYIWSFEELESYLIESGKTHDQNWLNNTLRPALQQAFVHVIRMNSGYFWKQSNVYEMFGCDFMLDDEMNVWFLEANPNPLLDGPLPNMITQMFKDLFEIEYGLLRSRMKRALAVIKAMQKEAGDEPPQDVDKWREMYQEAVKNRLEPEYKLSETNTWVPIIDESLPGVQAYFGRVSEECLEM